MKREELVNDSSRMYILSKDPETDACYFKVGVGGLFMDFIEFRLDAEELESYQREGKGFLDELSRMVCWKPERYKSREECMSFQS